ncbi:MAG: SBBP repeat-containing protein [Burkholderiaceae bacterium]|nr:SBBP repeat-containing protein [Burkholderiaceae bacterium]
MNKRLRLLCVASATVLVAACGGSDSPAPAPIPTPAPAPAPGPAPAPAPAPAVPVVTRIEVAPAGAIVAPGATAQFSARVLDQNGNAMNNITVRWRSNKADVTIDATGKITAGSAISSAQVTAEVGAITSVPATVMVAAVAPGARMVTDAEVLADPQPIDAQQTGRPGSRFRITLAGTAPAVGQVVIGSGAKPVAGRVVASTPVAGGNEVVFEVVGLAELFTQARISERFDATRLPVEFPSGTPTGSTVLADGSVEYRFTLGVPASAPAPVRATSASGGRVTAQGLIKRSFKAGPFRCKVDADAEPQLSASELQATVVNTMRVVEATFVVDNGATYAKVLAQGDVGLSLNGPIKLKGQLQGSFKCSAALVSIPIPLPPAVAVVVTPVIPIGARFGVDGRLNSPALDLTVASEVKQPIAAGFEMLPDGTFTNLSSLDTTQLNTTFNWNLSADSTDAAFSFDAGARAGLQADVAITNPLVRLASLLGDFDPNLTLVEGFAGFRAVGRLAPVGGQLAAPSQPSLYNVNFLAQLKAGDAVNDALKLIGAAAGATQFASPEVRWEPTLFRSPTGQGRSYLTRYIAGDRVEFLVELDPATLSARFLDRDVLPYNVKRVEVWRKLDGGGAQRLATQDASSGQTRFRFGWTADETNTTIGRVYALVVPVVGDSFPLLLSETLGWTGVTQVGSANDEANRGIVFDNDGRIYTIGYTFGGASRPDGQGGTVPLPKPGGADALVVKYNPFGAATDALLFGGTGDENPVQARVGPDGYLYVVGNGTNTNLTGGPATQFFSSFVSKIDLQRMAVVWTRQIGDTYEQPTGLDFGPDGSIYVASSVANPGAIGGDAFSTNCPNVKAVGSSDCGNIAVTKFAPDGTQLWRTVDARAGWQFGPNIAVSASGAVYVSALTYCEIEAGPSTCVANEGLVSGVNRVRQMTGVWRFDFDGAGGPLKTLKIDDPVEGKRDIALAASLIDGSGNLILGGGTDGSFGGAANVGGRNLLLLQLDSLGNTQWARMFGSPQGETLASRAIVRDASGDLYVAFGTSGSVFATNAGQRDVALMRLGADGTLRWGRQFGGTGDDRPLVVGLDPLGNVFVSGSTNGVLGDGLAAAFGGLDVFVAKFSPSAQRQSTGIGRRVAN